MLSMSDYSIFFFFNDTATTEIYTLSLHDALPILSDQMDGVEAAQIIKDRFDIPVVYLTANSDEARSEEHTSELQSQSNLVCRLLLEKKKHMTPMRLMHYNIERLSRSIHLFYGPQG